MGRLPELYSKAGNKEVPAVRPGRISAQDLPGVAGLQCSVVSAFSIKVKVRYKPMAVVTHRTMPEKSSSKLARELEELRKQLAQVERALAERMKAEQTDSQGRSAKSSRADRLGPGSAQQDEWITGLVHELRQPLTAIANYAKACAAMVGAGQNDSAELLHGLEQVSLQADRAAELLGHARRLVMPGDMQRSSLSINDAIGEAMHLLEGEIRSANVQVELHLAEPPTLLSADPLQIRLVLLNLLRNAVEALESTAPAERSIAIKVQCKETEIEVAIRDRGAGLSLKTMRGLFEPFQTTKPQGMGIGLALSRAIVQAHGGRLWAKTHAGRGTTFFFTIPKTITS
jgi:two-component system, LuxR family, sensor kinase FixL